MTMQWKKLLPALAALVLLSGCISALSGGSRKDFEPLTTRFEDMPYAAATITSAVAAQAITVPLEQSGTVLFPPGTDLSPEIQLGLEGFNYTGAELFAFTPAEAETPGVVAGEIEYTDPMDRRFLLLFRAEYAVKGEYFVIRQLRLDHRSPERPRVAVTVVPMRDVPREPMATYGELVDFLAAKGLSPAELAGAGKQEFAIYALGKDKVSADSRLSIAISASRTSSTGYARDCAPGLIEGRWPLAVAAGEWNPANSREPLFAKVYFSSGSGFGSRRKVGVYQLTGLK
ncbi:MAG: hypothetical protein H0S80_09120 [Desulfovibrionaceae bacterium]|nr:hypothetical protein [Desulfovibrionaceae bacterium]